MDDDCDHEQKVEKIVKLVEPTCPFSLPPRLLKPWQMKNVDTEQIADVIEQESLSLLEHVRFEDWLRHSLGYAERSVENLIRGQDCIAIRIPCYLRRYPAMTDTYRQVEQVSHCSRALSLTDSSSYCGTETQWLIKP